MRNRRIGILALLLGLASLSGAAADLGRPEGAWAQTESLEVVDPAEVEPFARAREVEALDGGAGVATSHRADGYLEDVYFNSPLYRGDRLETDGNNRAEIQFPDGSLVRLDTETLVEIVSMRDPTGRFSGSNLLAVHMGRVQVELAEADDGRDPFRVDTFACSVYPLDRAAFRIDVVDSRSVLVRVTGGNVEVVGERDAVNLEAGEMTEAHAGAPLGRPRPFNLLSRDHFARWIDFRDGAYALEAPPGEEYAELPEEVQPYYGELSSAGSWVWTDEYGYAWVPEVAVDWRPYYDGYWAYGPWGPTWVGYEPWGWICYRYGRWNFVLGTGWAWIPGRVWSTAWVSWHYGPSHIGWAPLGYHGGPWFWYDPWGYPVTGSGFVWSSHWHSYSTWNVVRYDEFYYKRVDKVAVRYKTSLVDDGGVVARRAVHTRRGESLRDGVERVRHSGRGLDPVAPPRKTVERRTAERSFHDEERRVLSPGRGRGPSPARDARASQGAARVADGSRRSPAGETARRSAAREAGGRSDAAARIPARRSDAAGRDGSAGRGRALLRPGDAGGAAGTARGSAARRTTGRDIGSADRLRRSPARSSGRSSPAAAPRGAGDPARRTDSQGRSSAPAPRATPRPQAPRRQPGGSPSAGEASSRDRLRRLLREANGERGGSAARLPSPPPSHSRPDPGASTDRSRAPRSGAASGSRPRSSRVTPSTGSRSRASGPASRGSGSSGSSGTSARSGRSGRSSGSGSRAGSSGGSSRSPSRSRGSTGSSGSPTRSSGGTKSSGSKSSGGRSSGGRSSGGGSKGRSSGRSRR